VAREGRVTTSWCAECGNDSHDYPDCDDVKPRLKDKLEPGRPVIYKTHHGWWASVTWTKDPSGALVVPQANTSHATWRAAMRRVERWYRGGRSSAW
jgi:hypothetical protein